MAYSKTGDIVEIIIMSLTLEPVSVGGGGCGLGIGVVEGDWVVMELVGGSFPFLYY